VSEITTWGVTTTEGDIASCLSERGLHGASPLANQESRAHSGHSGGTGGRPLNAEGSRARRFRRPLRALGRLPSATRAAR
jgi:hypothetical protein